MPTIDEEIYLSNKNAKPKDYVEIGVVCNPYLEVHHVIWLSRGGEDSTTNTVALCPNCHTRMHILDRPEDIDKLQELIK